MLWATKFFLRKESIFVLLTTDLQTRKKYYLGYINNRGQMKKGSKNHELLQLANSFVDFSEADIDERTQRIFTSFVDFLSQNMLLE